MYSRYLEFTCIFSKNVNLRLYIKRNCLYDSFFLRKLGISKNKIQVIIVLIEDITIELVLIDSLLIWDVVAFELERRYVNHCFSLVVILIWFTVDY